MNTIFPDIKKFTKKYNEGKAQIVWSVLPADLLTPVLATLRLHNEPYCCLFESVEKGANRARYSFIALDPDLIWKCENGVPLVCSMDNGKKSDFIQDGDDIFLSLRRLIKSYDMKIPEELPVMAAGIFGYMGYDMVQYMEKLPHKNPDSIGIAESIFIRPQVVIIFDSVKDEMIIAVSVYPDEYNADKLYINACNKINSVIKKLNEPSEADRTVFSGSEKLKISSNFTQKEFCNVVEKAKEYINAGDIFQVVLSQRFTVEFDKDPFLLYRSLRRLNPSPFSFYMKMEDMALVGSSPEILVRLKDTVATIRPIAGTRWRGKDNAEDKRLAEDLLSDEKELAEHLMLLDLGRNDIGRVAKGGTVKVTERMEIEYYSHVMHIVSNVEGHIKDDMDALDALVAGFPAGTVSGAPKIRAMEIIDELENVKRSFYAGGVGYFSANGDMETCIALRTGLVKDGKLYIQAGGGIVADSDPIYEYNESCNKAKALIKAAEMVCGRD